MQNSPWFEFFLPNRLCELEDKRPGPLIKDKIKYEIFPEDYLQKKVINEDDSDSEDSENKKISLLGNTDRKIFTRVIFMTYVFVFDYNNPKTFQKCLKYVKILKSDLSNKYEDKNKYPLFVFIGNKYSGFLPSNLFFSNKNQNLQIKNFDIFEDNNISRYLKQLVNEHIYYNEKEAKENLFIVNCKNNFCVRETFHAIFEKIQQDKKNLWNVKINAKEENLLLNDSDNDIFNNDNNGGYLQKMMFFCCDDRKKKHQKNHNSNNNLNIPVLKDRFAKSLIKIGVEKENENKINSIASKDSFELEEEGWENEDGKVFIPEQKITE